MVGPGRRRHRAAPEGPPHRGAHRPGPRPHHRRQPPLVPPRPPHRHGRRGGRVGDEPGLRRRRAPRPRQLPQLRQPRAPRGHVAAVRGHRRDGRRLPGPVRAGHRRQRLALQRVQRRQHRPVAGHRHGRPDRLARPAAARHGPGRRHPLVAARRPGHDPLGQRLGVVAGPPRGHAAPGRPRPRCAPRPPSSATPSPPTGSGRCTTSPAGSARRWPRWRSPPRSGARVELPEPGGHVALFAETPAAVVAAVDPSGARRSARRRRRPPEWRPRGRRGRGRPPRHRRPGRPRRSTDVHLAWQDRLPAALGAGTTQG